MSDFWTDYWRQGHLTSFGDSQGAGYQGALAAHWENTFTTRLSTDQILVDIGCGNGAMFDILLSTPVAEQVKLIGVDAASLTIPKKFLKPNVSFLQQTCAEALPLEADTIDMVISQFGLEYSDFSQSIEELARVLKKDGKLLCIMHCDTSSIVAPNASILAMAERLAEPECGLFALLNRYVLALRDNTDVEVHRTRFQNAFSQASEDNRNALDATNFPQFCQVLFDPQRDYNNRQIILKMFEDELIGQIERLSDLTQAALDENAQNALVDILTKSGFSDIKIDPFVDDNGDVLGIKVDANAS